MKTDIIEIKTYRIHLGVAAIQYKFIEVKNLLIQFFVLIFTTFCHNHQ